MADLYWVGWYIARMYTHGNNWGSSSGAHDLAGVPNSWDNVIFDSGSACGCDLDANGWGVTNVTLTSGFAYDFDLGGSYSYSCSGYFSIAGGTLTAGTFSGTSWTISGGTVNVASITVSSTFTVSGGACTTNALSVTSTFTVSSGTMTMPSGTAYLSGSISISGGTFNHNSGTINWTASSKSCGTNQYLNNLTIAADPTASFTTTYINGNFTASATGGSATLTQTSGNIYVKGNITISGNDAAWGTCTVAFILNGTGSQYINIAATDCPGGNMQINKASGTVYLSAALSLNKSGQDLQITSGILNCNAYNLTVNDTLTLDGGTLTVNAITLKCGKINMSSGTLTMTSGLITLTGSSGALFTRSGGTFTKGTSTLEFEGTGTCSVTFNPGGASFATVRIDMENLSVCTLTGTLSCDDLDVIYGTFDADTYAITVTNDIYVNGGTCYLGSNSITSAGFSLVSGECTATSGTWECTNAFTRSGGIFTHNNGLIKFTGTGYTVESSAAQFNDVEIDVTTIEFSGNILISGDLFITDATTMTGGTLKVSGNLSTEATGVSGTTAITITGSASLQEIDTDGGNGLLPGGTFLCEKSSGMVKLVNGDLVLNASGQDMTVNNGCHFCNNGFDVIVNDTLTVAAGSRFTKIAGSTVSYGSLSGDITLGISCSGYTAATPIFFP